MVTPKHVQGHAESTEKLEAPGKRQLLQALQDQQKQLKLLLLMKQQQQQQQRSGKSQLGTLHAVILSGVVWHAIYCISCELCFLLPHEVM